MSPICNNNDRSLGWGIPQRAAWGIMPPVNEQPTNNSEPSTERPEQDRAPVDTLRPSEGVERRENRPQQGEMPFAIVMGEAMTELPKDLYIPPRALEIILEAFEGPLDLLLYLIRRQNLDILDD